MRNLLISALLTAGLIACGAEDADSPPPPVDAQADHGHDHSAGGHAHGQDDPARAAAAAAPAGALFDTPPVDSSQWRVYGAGVREGEAVPVADVLADPAAYEGRPVRMRGPIASVCQESGSWIRLGTADENAFVRFKDYGFFVPEDAAGEAVVEGFVHVEEVSVALQKHLLEDAGRHEEAARVTEPKSSVSFEAHGVGIRKQD